MTEWILIRFLRIKVKLILSLFGEVDMAFPKNKRRKIVVRGITYEWCFSAGTLYYKAADGKEKPAAIYIDTWGKDHAMTPHMVAALIESRVGECPTPKMVADNKKKFEKAQLEDRAKFKLYVWEGVLADWTYGIIVAYARSLKEARQQVMKDVGYFSSSVKKDMSREPDHVISKPKGFVMGRWLMNIVEMGFCSRIA
jgi:hypothetical protein